MSGSGAPKLEMNRESNYHNSTCGYKEVMRQVDGKYAGKLQQCSGCRKVAYCSKECQRAHWAHRHKKDCKILSSASNIPTVNEIPNANNELIEIFQGKHGPPSERLKIWPFEKRHPDWTKEAMVEAYRNKLKKESIVDYCIEKFMMEGKGVVIFNLKNPVPYHRGNWRFLWMKMNNLAIMHPDLFDMSFNSDPEKSCLTLFILPSEDGTSADVFPREYNFVVKPEVAIKLREGHEQWLKRIANEEFNQWTPVNLRAMFPDA